MSDARLRELERRWRGTNDPQDGASFLRERERAGRITRDQICTAAFLGDEPSQEVLSDGLYDRTGEGNDHICGICPCGWCRWEEGPDKWIPALLTWGKSLPFKGIDVDHDASQEMAIRMGLALADAVWTKLYDPENSVFGLYVIAERRAKRFLEQRDRESRAPCRDLWVSELWTPAPEWLHQVLYHIIDPRHRTHNTWRWFVLSGDLLAARCSECESDVRTSGCGTCDSKRWWDNPQLARDVVRAALVPWVLSEAPQKEQA